MSLQPAVVGYNLICNGKRDGTLCCEVRGTGKTPEEAIHMAITAGWIIKSGNGDVSFDLANYIALCRTCRAAQEEDPSQVSIATNAEVAKRTWIVGERIELGSPCENCEKWSPRPLDARGFCPECVEKGLAGLEEFTRLSSGKGEPT